MDRHAQDISLRPRCFSSVSGQQRRQRVVVVGAGVVGICTAHELLARGFDVHVIDSREGAAGACSFGLAGQLSPFHSDPLARPGAWRKLWQSVTYRGPERMRLKLNSSLLRWGLHFLRACDEQHFRTGLRTNLALAMRTRARVLEMAETHGWNLHQLPLLYACTSEDAVKDIVDQCQLMKSADPHLLPHETTPERISIEELKQLEPDLSHAVDAGQIVGGFVLPTDVTADPYEFTSSLCESCEKRGASFHWGQRVTKAITETSSGGQVKIVALEASAVAAGHATTLHEADFFVFAAGASISPLLSSIGLRATVPVIPMRGSSVTAPVDTLREAGLVGQAVCRSHSVTFPPKYFSVSRFGGNLRMTDGADFIGWDPEVDQVKIKYIWSQLAQTWNGGRAPAGDTAVPVSQLKVPNIATYRGATRSAVADDDTAQASTGQITAWSGLRPMSPDFRPIVGPIPYHTNAFLNAGHGIIGWTLSMATAELCAHTVSAAAGAGAGAGAGAAAGAIPSKPALDHLPHLSPGRFYGALTHARIRALIQLDRKRGGKD